MITASRSEWKLFIKIVGIKLATKMWLFGKQIKNISSEKPFYSKKKKQNKKKKKNFYQVISRNFKCALLHRDVELDFQSERTGNLQI